MKLVVMQFAPSSCYALSLLDPNIFLNILSSHICSSLGRSIRMHQLVRQSLGDPTIHASLQDFLFFWNSALKCCICYYNTKSTLNHEHEQVFLLIAKVRGLLLPNSIGGIGGAVSNLGLARHAAYFQELTHVVPNFRRTKKKHTYL